MTKHEQLKIVQTVCPLSISCPSFFLSYNRLLAMAVVTIVCETAMDTTILVIIVSLTITTISQEAQLQQTIVEDPRPLHSLV